MKFAIITQVPHFKSDGKYFSYGPYVREMNIWLKYTDVAVVVAPLSNQEPSPIDLAYTEATVDFRPIPAFHIKNTRAALQTLWHLPQTCLRIWHAMRQADHIHLRCPGNIGLLGCILQVFFPSKPKTAKYAGNWDPNSKQPWSYKLQRYILSHTWLTRNMTVLVYGKWPGSSSNIKPFFTASYARSDMQETAMRSTSAAIRLLFVGALAAGKRPLYAVQLLEQLRRKGHDVQLELFGEGPQRVALESYIAEKELHAFAVLRGNQPAAVIKAAYQSAHLVLLPSQSEGWPKVLAEAMFWGCVPAGSSVSCVPDMLGHGQRGILLHMELKKDARQIHELLTDNERFQQMADNGKDWSRQYTLDFFEQEIKTLLKRP